MRRSKKIGVFVSHIYGDYQHKLCTGIIETAKEYGYFVDFFTSNDGENLGDYGLGEKSVLSIPRTQDYSGIIFASGTYLLPSLRDAIASYLEENFSCPIIDVNQVTSHFPCVSLENHSPFEDLITHLFEVHHITKIGYLGSNLEETYNALRLSIFQESMNKHGSTISNDYIYSTDFSEASMKQATDFFLNLSPRPEAIVCYNDCIAMALIKELEQQGLHVPADIAVTGCDMLDFGQHMNIPLTTITFPIEMVGKQAMEQLIHALHGKDIAPLTTIHAQAHYGASCGCKNKSISSSYGYSYALNDKISALEKNIISNMHMSASFQSSTDIDEAMTQTMQFAKLLPNCKALYICLYDNWDNISEDLQQLSLSDDYIADWDSMILKLALKDGVQLPECTFTKRSILPDFLYDSSTTAHIYSPLFFGEKEFGYIALAYTDDQISYDFPFISWLMNLNAMLNNICNNKKLDFLTNRLEDVYSRDELTGLYNRLGFRLHATPIFERALAENNAFYLSIWDIDGLKFINDNFGHMEGNFAIQVVAHALENSLDEGSVCGRIEGNEFQVVAPSYSESEAIAFEERVHKYLENYNRLQTKGYQIKASCGFCIKKLTSLDTLQNMQEEADEALKIKKRRKES